MLLICLLREVQSAKHAHLRSAVLGRPVGWVGDGHIGPRRLHGSGFIQGRNAADEHAAFYGIDTFDFDLAGGRALQRRIPDAVDERTVFEGR